MIIDTYAISEATALRTDICIVGAGAAGISMALALEEHKLPDQTKGTQTASR